MWFASDISFWDSCFLWRDPMIAAAMGGILLSYLGFYIVLTRSAFVSAAVSQFAGLGVVVAILLGASGHSKISPLMLGILFGIAGTSLFALPRRNNRLATDSLLAIAVIGTSALTMVFARYLTREYQHVRATLYGDAVVASRNELYLLAATCTFVLLLHFFFRQRFLLITFDQDSAKAQGMHTKRWGFLLGITLGLSISVVTRGMGALPAFAFSILPASAALLLTQNLKLALWLAAGFAFLSATLGYYTSFVADLPTGPTMVTVAFLCLLPGGLYALFRKRHNT